MRRYLLGTSSHDNYKTETGINMVKMIEWTDVKI